MYRHQHYPKYTADPIMVLVRYEMEQHLRQAERLRLVREARAAQESGPAPVPALIRWLRTRLGVRSRAGRADLPLTPADALPTAAHA